MYLGKPQFIKAKNLLPGDRCAYNVGIYNHITEHMQINYATILDILEESEVEDSSAFCRSQGGEYGRILFLTEIVAPTGTFKQQYSLPAEWDIVLLYRESK